MRRLIEAALAACIALAPIGAQAQDHSFPTPGNATVGGAVDMFLNPSGNAIPVSAANPFPVTIISGGGGGGAVTQGTVPWVDNITQWASVTLGAATAWGVAPTGNVPGVNANILGPLGQQLAAASVPVVLTAAQIAALTPAAILPQSDTVPIGGIGICDGANGATNPCTTAATVKPTSTAPVTATDKALVVDLRPDSPGIIALGPNTDANSVPVVNTPSGNTAAGITPVVCGSAVSSCVLKNAAGSLYSVYADCTAACWLMVFNAASAPSNGATTAGTAASNMTECISVPAGSIGGINYGLGPPAVYSTGITAVISSTACATLTLSTVGFIHGMKM